MALMWRPGRASRGVLVLVAAISILGYLLVEQLPEQQRKKYYAEKRAAAKLMDAGMKVIHQKRLQIFGRIDPEHDPLGTGMIGSGLTPITSKTGSISAKQTSANPNFAAVMILIRLNTPFPAAKITPCFAPSHRKMRKKQRPNSKLNSRDRYFSSEK